MIDTTSPSAPSFEFKHESRASRVLKAAQTAVDLDARRHQAVMQASSEIMNVNRNRFVSYALHTEWDRQFSWRDSTAGVMCQPSLSTSIEMLRSVRLSKRIKDGILLNELFNERMSSAEYFSALNSIQRLISALEQTNEPYVLLTHIHDQYNVGFHFGHKTAEDAVTKMAEVIGKSLSFTLDPKRKIMGGDEGVFVGCLDCRDAENGLCDSCYEKYM